MEKPKLKDFDRVLIVEGYGDLLFYAEMLESLGKHKAVFIQKFNGKTDLCAQLEVFITPQLLAEKTHIGVVVDADENPDGTFSSIQAAIAKAANQKVPNAGTWTDGNPRIGIFIAPDPANKGEIETLVWRAWSADRANDAAKGHIDTYASSMRAAGFEAKSREKGLIGALLAIRNDDDPRLGPGARTNVFDLEHTEFAELRAFLSVF
ncbi:MAG: hypothetical protein NTZ46_10365 [Verrucomicrobia bacterium]|nr:hypothetical protein [Verrucomicrobiota bacterium]